MIPAPFMDRNETIRRLEGHMLAAVIKWANDPKVRAAWQWEAMQDSLLDSFEGVRRQNIHPEDF